MHSFRYYIGPFCPHACRYAIGSFRPHVVILLVILIPCRYSIGPFRPGGGGGGTQIWFRRGCAAEAAKPVPIFKGHFGGKGYP